MRRLAVKILHLPGLRWLRMYLCNQRAWREFSKWKNEPLRDGMRIVVNGIGYRVTVAEGMVSFSQTDCVWGWSCRVNFSKHGQCWYMDILSTRENTVMASHVVEMYRRVCQTFGGNHATAKQCRGDGGR